MRCTSPACLPATRQWWEPSQPLFKNSPPLLSLYLALSRSLSLSLSLYLSLSSLTATLCFSLCFSWSACLPPEGSSLFLLLQLAGGEQSGAHPNRLGLSGKLFLSLWLAPSLILSVCLSSVAPGKGTLLHPALRHPFSCCLFIAEV